MHGQLHALTALIPVKTAPVDRKPLERGVKFAPVRNRTAAPRYQIRGLVTAPPWLTQPGYKHI
jgi:hypothetical protein